MKDASSYLAGYAQGRVGAVCSEPENPDYCEGFNEGRAVRHMESDNRKRELLRATPHQRAHLCRFYAATEKAA